MELNGAQILLECLKREGVDTVFGYPGGAVIDLYDELPNYPIKHYLVRHEQGATHAADAYARASGRTGVCIATSGPGATNTVTGIATAYMDSVPMVIITGQVPSPLIGNDAFQEVDIVGITRPCTKHNYLVKDIKDVTLTVRRAFHLASTGRPGPVLVDIAKDVFQDMAEFVWPGEDEIAMRSYRPNIQPNKRQIKKAASLVEHAERPVFYIGGGVVGGDASEALTKLAEELCVPVTSTLMGLGGYPASRGNYIGMLGMHGTYAANKAMQDADLIIAVGARFDDRVTGRVDRFAPHAHIVHIDVDPTSISKNVRVDVPIVADCAASLTALHEYLHENCSAIDFESRFAQWTEKVEGWKAEHPLAFHDEPGVIKPQAVVQKLHELTKGDAIITTEVGQNQMWAAQYYPFEKPRRFLSSGGLGTMGYGLPAAIGAQVAFPDMTVIDVAGDGSIQMNIQELGTAMAYKLPVKVIILNNCYLGMVRQWQELFYDKNYCSTCMDDQPDFVKLAEAYNAFGCRIEKPEELESKLQEALSFDGPAVVDVRVCREENVYPMVPAGKSLGEMLLV